jgi:hypothetical protein
MRSLRLLPLFFLTACPYVDTPPTEATSTALKLSDVAVLFPLPATQAADSLLRPTSEGSHGSLLPAYAQEAVDLFPAARRAAGWTAGALGGRPAPRRAQPRRLFPRRRRRLPRAARDLPADRHRTAW